MNETHEWLAEYVKNGSEPAFRELVRHYLNLVYSTAVRLVNGDTHLAEDIAQTVFADLARKARRLPDNVMLGGWLHRHTCRKIGMTLGSNEDAARMRVTLSLLSLPPHVQSPGFRSLAWYKSALCPCVVRGKAVPCQNPFGNRRHFSRRGGFWVPPDQNVARAPIRARSRVRTESDDAGFISTNS